MTQLTYNPKLINPLVEGLHESDTLVINEKSKKLIAQGKTVYKFGLGQSPFPVPDIIIDALRLHASQKDYLPVRGLQALREAVADFHRRKDSLNVQAEGVIIGPGSKELLFLLQLVFNVETIIVSPCWVSYIPQAKIIGKKISVIHSTSNDKWQLSASLFEEFLKNRKNPKEPGLLILNYPGNPDGVSFKEIDLKAIAKLAQEHNILILSDEIYGQLHHEGRHVSIGKYYPEGTIISSGLSKWCGAGGWRLGTFTFPKDLYWLIDKMAVVASETYTSVSAPIQYAAIQAFRGGSEIEEYLIHVRKILRTIGKSSSEILNHANIKTHLPEGGFYLFLDFSAYSEQFKKNGIHSSAELCAKLLEEAGVAILHGSAFSREEHEFTARLAYVDFDGSRALAAARTTALDKNLPEDFNSYYCPNVIEGMNTIVKWIKSIT